MSTFSHRLAAWQAQHGRHQLPWQCSDPYRIWLSEIMLQQTQVATVLDYYPRFVKAFPTVADLAAADIDEVSALWAGLGYYSRARNLHHAAKQVMEDFAGIMPKNRFELETLKGIGRSTAAAISVFAYGQKEAILDGNVKRVLARHAGIFGVPDEPKTLAKLWQEAEQRLPDDAETLRRYTQGLMDLGSLICTRNKPKCEICPVVDDCYAYQHGKTAELPTKKARKIKPEKSTVMLIAIDAQNVFLQRRPDHGIWRNLWSFPEYEDLNQASKAAKDLGKVQQIEQLPAFKHTFTHYILNITPLRIELSAKDKTLFFPLEKAQQKGLPAPVQRLLTELEKPIQKTLSF